MLFHVLKFVHVVSAILFVGTGLGTAFFKFLADRANDVRVTAWCARQAVLADWLFTTPATIALPLTAFGLISELSLSWRSPWILAGLAGYAVATALWLPAVWLQLEMRRLSEDASRKNAELPPLFHRYGRIWSVLGVPSFAATLFTLWVMVAKRAAF